MVPDWQQARARSEKVSVTISGVFHSVLSGTTSRAAARSHTAPVLAQPASPEQEALHRCVIYRHAFPMTEIALPALALRNRVVAKWVRDHSLAVDVRSGEELAVAIASGIHPTRMTVHADTLYANEILFCTANLGVGRVVVSSTDQIEPLVVAPHRRQGVLVGMTDVNAPAPGGNGRDIRRWGFRFDTGEADDAVKAIVDHGRLDLIGLHCEIGSQDRDFVSYPAAIGHMIAEMTYIRHDHGIVATRLSLGGGRAVPSGDWTVELPELASEIDESLDDACATLRFPRPMVVLSTGLAIIGQHAA